MNTNINTNINTNRDENRDENKKNNLVITIMAAGEGKRMKSELPKVLHPCGDIPMVVRIIKESLLLSSKIIVITGKFDQEIKESIQSYLTSEEWILLHFVQQLNPCGTGDAIKVSLDCYHDEETVIILNGDMPLINSTIIDNFHQQTKENNALIISKLENPFGYGRIIVNEKKEIIKIVEEKDCDKSEKQISLVNTGLYKFDACILKEFIPQIKNNNKQKEYYLTDMVELLNKNNVKVGSFLIDEQYKKYIKGVNTPEELKEAELLLS